MRGPPGRNVYHMSLRHFLALCLVFFLYGAGASAAEAGKSIYVIPIRDEIATPMTYLVRRGVKQAMEEKADVLILDMETNGGRLDSTEQILEALNQFRGLTVTYVNRKAFSAGAFIAFGTQRIYMAPQSVIGAAAPMLMGPGGGVESLPETVEAKMTSGVRALVRTSAEKNGYNVEVVEAMIDKSKQVEIDGEVINEKGQILTLTNVQAEKEYGNPRKALLSSGTVDSLEELIRKLDVGEAKVVRILPTGAEQVGSWLTAIGPILLLMGIVGVYIEMKTPGFGLPGVVGLIGFALYFLGGYVAGLSGLEWTVIFLIGLGLFILEIFVFPGTFFVGLLGGVMMLAALVMAMVDLYPGMPAIPSFELVRKPLLRVLLSAALSIVIMMVLSRFLLKTPMFHQMVAETASGSRSVQRAAQVQSTRLGRIGQTVSPLRPGGKAQFGEDLLDVITQGEMIGRGAAVRIIGFSGPEAVVEKVSEHGQGA
jgi:membrane-bound serine protease (ClpP class)